MKLVIEHDDHPALAYEEIESLSSFALYHRRYNLPNHSHIDSASCESWEDLKKAIVRNCDVVYIVPVYMYDHGNTAYSTTPFSCRFDSGQVGFAYVTREQLHYLGKKRVTKKCREYLDSIIQRELQTWEDYSNGNVYSYTLIDDNGREEFSCHGFIGSDHATNGIRHTLPGYEALVDKIGHGVGCFSDVG